MRRMTSSTRQRREVYSGTSEQLPYSFVANPGMSSTPLTCLVGRLCLCAVLQAP